MTNDTSTLNGALTELGELMADNLVTMGVTDATASDGLTTLANRILDVPQGSCLTLDLTSDKSILSYADTESATLTATVTNNGTPKSGESVQFYIDDVAWGSPVTTNASGVATKTYNSSGVGDITVKAECRLLSETYDIEDCLFYTPSEYECTPSNNYITISDLSDTALPSEFELSFDYKTNAEGRCGVFSKNNFTGNPNYAVFVGSGDGRNWYYGYRTTSTSVWGGSGSPNSYNHYDIIRNGNTFTYKRDGSTINSKSITFFDTYRYVIGIMLWGSTTQVSYAKNIKIKPL